MPSISGICFRTLKVRNLGNRLETKGSSQLGAMGAEGSKEADSSPSTGLTAGEYPPFELLCILQPAGGHLFKYERKGGWRSQGVYSVHLFGHTFDSHSWRPRHQYPAPHVAFRRGIQSRTPIHAQMEAVETRAKALILGRTVVELCWPTLIHKGG